MKRISRLTLALGTVALLALLLFLAVGAQPTALADGNIIKVPDDHPTIQTAIDAAVDGDMILVAASDYAYKENLSITKGITLSGGWNISFTNRIPGQSVIDGQGAGRGISITCVTSDTVVTVDGFTVRNGNSSGQGAHSETVTEIGYASVHGSLLQSSHELADTPSPAEQATQLQARLGDMADRGLYPRDSAAYQTMLIKLDRLSAQAEQSQARQHPAAQQPAQPAGSGGGVYSWNASLHLLNSTIQDNVAGMNGDGYGGGVFVGQAAPFGVIIAGNTVQYNTASMYADGKGGGLYLFQTPGVVVEDNYFLENAASNGGPLGVGGGLYVDHSPDALVQGNKVEANTAHASWDCLGVGGGGIGGGAQVRLSDGTIVKDNLFRNNLAALHCGSHSGGLYFYRNANIQVVDNEIIDNWGVLFQVYTDDFGGGLGLDTLDNATVTGNVLRGNITSLVTPDAGWNVSYGGGIFGGILSDSLIMSNTVIANIASVDHTAFGGGMYLEGTYNVVVAHNVVADNTASLSDSGGGHAGALNLRDTEGSVVRNNHFQSNRGSAKGSGLAGALNIESHGPHSFDTTVDANLFLDNQASGDSSGHSVGGACVVNTRGFTFTNNVVAGNTADEAGGLIFGATERSVISNNTLAGNSGAGVVVQKWLTTPVTITNNIIVNHTVGISVTEGATATVRYTLWDGNDTDIGGGGVISHTHPVTGDPAFIDQSDHDYHLTLVSAARDAGDPTGVPPAPDYDRDGVTRPQGVAVDIGAYEWQGYYQYLPLVAKSFDPRTGWAIGQDENYTAAIVHTADGGLTWQAQGDSTAWADLSGNDISAVDDLTAWAALGSGPGEASGTILHTTDGGATWVSQAIPDGLAGGVKGIKGLSRDEAWAASYDGTVLHTTDGGGTWNIVPHPTTPITQVNRMDAMGTNVWIADAVDGFSGAGAVVHTSDGGLTWRSEYLPQDGPLTVHAFSPMAVWGSGTVNLAFYRTVNGGAQWAQVSAVGGRDHMDDVCAASADDAWGVQNGGGADGRIWLVHMAADGTPDAKDITPPELEGYAPGGVTCLDTSEAWVVAQQGVPHPADPLGIILHTTDGGESWAQQSAPTDIEYWKISFVGARR